MLKYKKLKTVAKNHIFVRDIHDAILSIRRIAIQKMLAYPSTCSKFNNCSRQTAKIFLLHRGLGLRECHTPQLEASHWLLKKAYLRIRIYWLNSKIDVCIIKKKYYEDKYLRSSVLSNMHIVQLYIRYLCTYTM